MNPTDIFTKALGLSPGEKIRLEFPTEQEMDSFRSLLYKEKTKLQGISKDLANAISIRRETDKRNDVFRIYVLQAPVITAMIERPDGSVRELED